MNGYPFIEKAGTGIKRIREEARQGGYPEPATRLGARREGASRGRVQRTEMEALFTIRWAVQ